jgi:predicted nucleic acid-binding protein
MTDPRSGPASLEARLAAASLVHIDASVFAHHLVASPEYVDLTRTVFDLLSADRMAGQTSAVSLYQILAEPYRRGESGTAEDVGKRLSGCPGLDVVPVTAEIAAQAAQAQAQLGGRIERAIQIATAVDGGADLYLTEGSRLRRIAGIPVADLKEFRP